MDNFRSSAAFVQVTGPMPGTLSAEAVRYINALQRAIAALQAQNATLQAQIADHETRIAALEP